MTGRNRRHVLNPDKASFDGFPILFQPFCLALFLRFHFQRFFQRLRQVDFVDFGVREQVGTDREIDGFFGGSSLRVGASFGTRVIFGDGKHGCSVKETRLRLIYVCQGGF
jgi:hypothetical protein